jgi:hypothetical protein
MHEKLLAGADFCSFPMSPVRTEVRTRLTELADRLRRSVQSPPRVAQVTRPATAEHSTSVRSALGDRRGSAVTTKPSAASADAADPAVTKPTAVNGATDLTDGNKAVPQKKAPQSQLRPRAAASLNQARDSLERLGDALRKAVTPHRAHRAHRH